MILKAVKDYDMRTKTVHSTGIAVRWVRVQTALAPSRVEVRAEEARSVTCVRQQGGNKDNLEDDGG